MLTPAYTARSGPIARALVYLHLAHIPKVELHTSRDDLGKPELSGSRVNLAFGIELGLCSRRRKVQKTDTRECARRRSGSANQRITRYFCYRKLPLKWADLLRLVDQRLLDERPESRE